MRKFLLLLILLPYLLCVNGESGDRVEPRLLESIYYKSSSDIAPTTELPKVKSVIDKALADSTMILHLVGYDDGAKGEDNSNYLSSNRSIFLAEYVKSYGIDKERVSYEDGGLDVKTDDNSKRCRVDIFQIFVDSTTLAAVTPTVEHVSTSGSVVKVGETTNRGAIHTESIILDTDLDDFYTSKYRVDLRTNMLYWFCGVMNLGCEIGFTKNNLGLLINGGYSVLGGADWENSFGVWFVAPELRFYFPRNPKWFMGVELLCGEYNCKLTDTGYQGSIYGGGVTTGFRTKLSHHIDIEFSLGLGYSYLNYDTYYHKDNINVVQQWDVSRGVAMPVQAGVTLILGLGKSVAVD